MKIGSIVTLTLVLLAVVCTIISMASFWEYVHIKSVTGSDATDVKVYLRFDKMKLSMVSNDMTISQTVTIPEEYKTQMKDTFQIHNASFAFNVLAFISLIVSFAIVLCTIIPGVSAKVPSIVPMIGKVMIIVSLVFCLISMLVFLGIPNARYNDCKRNNPGEEETNCPKEGYYKDFSGSSTGAAFGSAGELSFGPYTSWITITIASGLSLAAVIMSFVGGVFKVETPEH